MAYSNLKAVKRFPVAHPSAPPPGEDTTLPFGVDFQKSLIRLMAEDPNFGSLLVDRLQPEFFENEVLAWVLNFFKIYKQKYNAVPSLRVVGEETRVLPAETREFYRLLVWEVTQADLRCEDWLRDKTIDFVKRNLFVQGWKQGRELFNTGKISESYDHMMGVLDQIYNTAWEHADREFFFEAFGQRQSDRLSRDVGADAIPTGIHELDMILGGGLSLGELGIWLAYPKRGKTTLLVNHGAQAVRRSDRNVLHVVFEGSRQMVASRYDTLFAQEAYSRVKQGQISKEAHERMVYDYQMFRKRLVIRGFTEKWTYSVADIHEEKKDLKRTFGWEPELIIVDYGDLLRAREVHKVGTETEMQRAAYRDLKTLANQGHAIWTASQPQRPKDNSDVSEDLLYSRKIADCYDKIRVADFIGSLNATDAEMANHVMRLFAELYRDNAANKVIRIYQDFSRMTLASIPATNQTGAGPTFAPTFQPPATLGLAAAKCYQQRAPI
jgi:hypothetical protein